MIRLQSKEKGIWKTMIKGKDWEYTGKNILILPPFRKSLPKKPILITKKQWSQLRFGSILKSPGGALRRNINKSRVPGAVVFVKIGRSQYSYANTVYGYNDICRSYKVVKI